MAPRKKIILVEQSDGSFSKKLVDLSRLESPHYPSRRRKRTFPLILIFILTIISVGSCIYFFLNRNQVIEAYSYEKKEWLIQDQRLKKELESLKKSYDRIALENIALREQRESPERTAKLESILKENKQLKLKVKNLENSAHSPISYIAKGSNILNEKIKELTGKVELLESQLAVLVEENTTLAKKNEDIHHLLEANFRLLKRVEQERSELSERIKNAAKLDIEDIYAGGIKRTNSGDIKVKNKLKQIDQIQVCFTIAANKLAQAGDRDIYVKIIDERGRVLHNKNTVASIDDLFSFETYSMHKVQPYTGKEEMVCMYYEIENQLLHEGEYAVKIQLDSELAGTSSFVLE